MASETSSTSRSIWADDEPGVSYQHQPAFEKAFADITGTTPPDGEWKREVNWNFTADDISYTQ